MGDVDQITGEQGISSRLLEIIVLVFDDDDFNDFNSG